jgi:hypothetical protein
VFDGTDDVIGGQTSGSMFPSYSPIVSSHLAMDSPLAITASYVVIGSNGTLNVQIEVTGAISTTDNFVHFVVTENEAHNQVNLARAMLQDEPFTLSQPGQTASVLRSFTPGPDWVEENLRIAVFVQSHSGDRSVLQAALATPDYAATVVVTPQPDGLGAPWHLAGPAGYDLEGQGDVALPVWQAGSYQLTWQPVNGWTLPDPSTEMKDVPEGSTVTFVGAYTNPPFVAVTAGPLGDSGPGRGVAMIDYDQDGDLDISVINYNQPDLLLRNDGGDTFVDVASGPAADSGPGQGIAWADYDNDGDWDFYLSRDDAPNILARNEGDGTFTASTSFGLEDAGPGRGVSWADYNNDGLLDLYLVNNGTENKLFRSFGGMGGFWVFGLVAGAVGDSGPGANAAWCDYDNDGDLDLYLTNRFAPNRLFENLGSLGFFDAQGIGPLGGIANGSGTAWGDYDNDGDFDAYLVNDGMANVLAINTNGSFTPLAAGPEVDSGSGKGVVWADFDNDMDLDLYIGRPGQPDLYLRNDGPMTFSVVPLAIAAANGNATGVTCGDYDQDGDIDVYVANDGAGNVLLRNESPGTFHWLHVDLVGITSNRSAIGARVRLVTGGTVQLREISCGGGYQSQDSPTAEFGLAWHTVADTLLIRWPSGTVQTFTAVSADRHLVIDENGAFSVVAVGGSADLAPSLRVYPCFPNPFNPRTTLQYDLPAPARVTLRLYDAAGQLVRALREGGFETAGRHEVVWNGQDQAGRPVASGTYFYLLEAGGQRASGPMVLIK